MLEIAVPTRAEDMSFALCHAGRSVIMADQVPAGGLVGVRRPVPLSGQRNKARVKDGEIRDCHGVGMQVNGLALYHTLLGCL